MSFECFAQLAASWPISVVLCHAALSLLFFSSSTFDVSFPDVSDYFLRDTGCCFSGPCKLWASSLLVDIKQEQCQCGQIFLSAGWFHSCLSVWLSFLSFFSFFFFEEMCRASKLSCVQCTTLSLPSLSLASLRSRLIAGVELYIQVNSWDGQPLSNAHVLCLSQTLVYCSTLSCVYTHWVLQSLFSWTLRFCVLHRERATIMVLSGILCRAEITGASVGISSKTDKCFSSRKKKSPQTSLEHFNSFHTGCFIRKDIFFSWISYQCQH